MIIGAEIRITQITHTKGNAYTSLSLSSDGKRLAYAANHMASKEGNATEIWLWDETYGFRQITNGDLSSSPRLSADGRAIVFSSRANLTGENPKASQQIFLWKEGEGFRQITENRSGREENGSPQIDAQGRAVAFVNVSQSAVVLLWSEQESALRKISSGIACALSADSTKVAFLDGPPARRQIFLWSKEDFVAPISGPSEGNVSHLSMSADGTRIAFRGGFGAADSTAFLWTDGVGIKEIGPGRDPAISGDGRTIAFKPRSGADILLWTDAGPITRVTGSGRNVALSFDGRRIAFTSDLDLTGENPDRSEQIFLGEIDNKK